MKRQILVLAALFIGVLAARPALADDYYGSIAFSTNSGALGWAYDYGSQGDAENEAVSQCGAGCVSVLWFKNACGAIATSSNHSYGAAWATSHEAAEASAMQYCQQNASDCSVERWVCTTR